MSRLASYEQFEFDSTNLTGSFQDFGTPLVNPVIVISFLNPSDVDVYLSIDGINNTWRIPAGATYTLDSRDISDNNNDSIYLIRKGVQIEIMQVTGAGTSGDIIGNITCQQLP